MKGQLSCQGHRATISGARGMAYLVRAGRSWGAANTLASSTSRLMEVTMSPEVYHVAVVGLMIVQIIVSITLRS